MLIGVTEPGTAQSTSSTGRSTLSGVYTEAQADRGKDLYAAMCRSCHTVATHTPTFKASWSGRPLSDLFGYISQNMPQNSPGALSPDEDAVVVAYLLRMMGLPAGTTELPSDVTLLEQIQFDTLTAATSRPN